MRFSRFQAVILVTTLTLGFPLLPFDRFFSLPSVAIAQTVEQQRAKAQELISQATWTYNAKHPEASLERFEQAARIFREIGDREAEASVLESMAKLPEQEGRFVQNAGYLQRALAVYQAIGDRKKAIKTLIDLGTSYRILGQPEQAMKAYQQALEGIRKMPDQSGKQLVEAETLNQIGVLYRIMGQAQPALKAHQQALSLYQGDQDSYEETRTLIKIAALHQDLKQSQQAIATYQQAWAILQKQPQDVGRSLRVMVLNSIGNLYKAQGQPQQAANYFQQAASVQASATMPNLRTSGIRIGEIVVLQEIGKFYLVDGRLDLASLYFQQAAAISKQSTDPYAALTTLDGIERAYRQQGQLEQALIYAEQVLPVMKKMGNRRGEASKLLSIGRLQQDAGKLPQALLSYQNALSMFRILGKQERDEAEVLEGIGDLYKVQGQKRQALASYQKALSTYTQLGSTNDKVRIFKRIKEMQQSAEKPKPAQ